jgi:hypothetical protein
LELAGILKYCVTAEFHMIMTLQVLSHRVGKTLILEREWHFSDDCVIAVPLFR